MHIERRDFIAGAFATAAATTLAGGNGEKPKAAPAHATPAPPRPLIDSKPVLQNPAETSVGVAFSVTAPCCAWVDVSRNSDLSGSVRFWACGLGLKDIAESVALVRATALEPNTKYYYRVGADRIVYNNGYDIRNLGSETPGEIHSFTTLGPEAQGSFAVINDTHERERTLGLVFDKIAQLSPSAVVWNGDASNRSETLEHAKKVFLSPHPGHTSFAADTPYLFVPGNHDCRGLANRRLERVFMLRENAERKSAFSSLGRNFAVRTGDIALIGLDTGEDKLDTNPKFAGVFSMGPYRELQTRWLADAIESETVKTARFKVAFCHIPLFDPRAQANPGDLAPADAAPGFVNDFAAWQRTCANMWGPLFEKAGMDLLICGHQHRVRFDPPSGGRSWAQIIGGGPDTGTGNPAGVPTVIDGRIENGRLVVRVHDVEHGKILFDWRSRA